MKRGFFKRIRAYKLGTQFAIAVVLFIVFLVAFGLYWVPSISEHSIWSQLVLALFTSILVSFLTVVVDIIVAYKKNRKDEYLESLREFGIDNLYLDKEAILSELLADCDRRIWVSGYRLILTAKLKKHIQDAMCRGADFFAVICPPWTEAFKLVYGTNEKVIDNYLQVFNAVNKARIDKNKEISRVRVVFINKPLFSDTYRVDQHIVTGSYMHNKDEEYNVLMAKDFFSYDLVRESSLSDLINDEYVYLFQEAPYELDWSEFQNVYDEIRNGDYSEAQKIEILQRAVVEHKRIQNERKVMT